MTILKLNWEIRILEILFEALKVKFGIFGKFEKWYFKIKFELLEFLENYLKNEILKIKFKNLNFGKLNLKKMKSWKIGILRNYFKK